MSPIEEVTDHILFMTGGGTGIGWRISNGGGIDVWGEGGSSGCSLRSPRPAYWLRREWAH